MVPATADFRTLGCFSAPGQIRHSQGGMMGTTIDSASQECESSTSDDRIWAGLAHGSGLLVFLGPLAAVILWSTMRKKSGYVAFQALQAMVYQSVFFWAYFTVIPLGMTVLLVVWIFGLVMLAPNRNDPFLIAVVPQIAIWAVLLGSFVIYELMAIVAAVLSLMGREFRYPFFGNPLARFLGYQVSPQASLLEDREERVVAAVSHSTFTLVFFGLLTPIAVWFTNQERSAFLRFQALQAAIYQVIGAAGYAAFMALNLLFVFGSLGAMMLTSFASRPSAEPAWLGLIAILFLSLTCIFLLVLPLYHLFGFLATLGVLRGRNFRYPILGRILASRLKSVGGT